MNTVKTLAAVAIASLALSACEVDVKDEGKLPSVDVDAKEGQMPEYEVVKKQEGEMPEVNVDAEAGRLPDVDVRGPDVDVGTKEIDIPDSIKVPTIDIDMPDKKGGEK